MTACPEILDELRACGSPRQEELDWFLRQGVPVMALAYPDPLWTGHVMFSGVGFEFARHRSAAEPERAIVFPARDEWGDLDDLVAWQPRTGAIGTWRGRVAMLGQAQVYEPRLGEPLDVHPGPLEWLRAERQGVAVVDPHRAAGLLREAGTLKVAIVADGRRLRELLTMPAPRILVAPPGADRRAA